MAASNLSSLMPVVMSKHEVNEDLDIILNPVDVLVGDSEYTELSIGHWGMSYPKSGVKMILLLDTPISLLWQIINLQL